MKTWKRYDNKKTPFTEEEIANIIKTKYNESFPRTKEYIANGLRNIGGKFKFRVGSIIREDIPQIYLESRKGFDFIFNYDFKLLPEIINSWDEKIQVICTDTIAGVQIGKFTTTLNSLIKKRKDVIDYKKIKPYLNTNYKDRPDTITKTIKYIRKLPKSIINKFDISEVVYLGALLPVKLTCKNCGEVQWKKAHDVYYLNGCRYCNYKTFHESTLEDRKNAWIEKAKSIHGNASDYSNIIYKGEASVVDNIKCSKCGEFYSQLSSSHLNSPYGYCPSCCKKIVGEHGRSNIDNVKEKAIERYGDVFIWDKAIYTTNQTPITLIYKETGEEFQITPNHLLNGVGLPIFHINSWGERNAVRWFEENNIKYRSEVTIKDIEGRKGEGSRVRIDFILEDGTWIELNGKQHYEFSQSFQDYINLTYEEAKDRWEGQLRRDENVKNYCKENNIRLLVIPYTYYDYPTLSDLLYKLIILKESIDIIKQPEIIYGKI